MVLSNLSNLISMLYIVKTADGLNEEESYLCLIYSFDR